MKKLIPDSVPETPQEKKHFISDGFGFAFLKQLPELLNTRNAESLNEAKGKYQLARISFSYDEKEAQTFDKTVIQALDNIINSGTELVITKKNAAILKAFILPEAPELGGITIVHIEIVNKLFNKYGSQFPGETLESWQKRFSTENSKLNPIAMEIKAQNNNNRLLLFTIIKAIDDSLYPQVPTGFNQLIKNKFGFDYESAKSRIKRKHPDYSIITELLKAKQKLDDF
jgi:hypothetical protein